MGYAPNSDNYLVGGARLYVQRKGTTGLINCGNIVSPAFASSIQTLDHYTSYSGQRFRDKQVVTQRDISFNCQLDEFNPDNLALFFGANDIEDYEQAASASGTASVTLVEGRAVSVGKEMISEVTIASLVEDVDFSVDYELGLVTALKSTAAGAKTVSFTAAAIDGKQFGLATESGIYEVNKIKIAVVGSDGKVVAYDHNKATVTPNGDLSIGDTDWSNMSFSVALLNNGSRERPFGTKRTFQL